MQAEMNEDSAPTSPGPSVQFLNTQRVENNCCHEPEENSNASVPWQIYISRGLSNWGDRLWCFGVGIFLIKLNPDDLTLPAVFGFVMGVSVILLAPSVGSWIDRMPRLRAAVTLYVIQNLTIPVACAFVLIHFSVPQAKAALPTWFVPSGVILFSTISNLATVGTKICVEKDWLVVIAGEGRGDRLASMNSVFRTIDLTCMVIAPLGAGLVFDWASTSVAAASIAAWNLISLILELRLLLNIYRQFPQLAEPRRNSQSDAEMVSNTKDEETGVSGTLRDWFGGLTLSWGLYARSPARDAGLSLAMLFMTVLGWDNITYGYALALCLSESVMGALVGVSAIVGVAGSLAYPRIRMRVGLDNTGLVGYSTLVSILSLAVVSVWLPGSPFQDYTSPIFNQDNYNGTVNGTAVETSSKVDLCKSYDYTSVSIFLTSTILNRFGLWISDLSVTQIMQEQVPEAHRGKINGVQTGLNSLLNTVKFTLVMLLPRLQTFGYLIIASTAASTIGGLFFIVYYISSKSSNRKHEKSECKDNRKTDLNCQNSKECKELL